MRGYRMLFVIGLVLTMVISGVGVTGQPVRQAAAAVQESDPSVDVRPVAAKRIVKGAEETAPKVAASEPAWPRPGRLQVRVPEPGKLSDAGTSAVRVGRAGGGGPETVTVETLSPETARALGGVGVAARVTRADGGTAPGKVRAAFSYAGFRDAFGGQFAGRLKVARLPSCVLQAPRPRSCVVRPVMVNAVNDRRAGTLTAEVEAAPANAAQPTVKAPALSANRKADAVKAADAALGAHLAAGSIYVLTGDLTGPDGNWGATDLRPSGTWQAGTSGGGFDYDLPLPEAPSVAGDGPDLALQYSASSVDGQGSWTNNQSGVVGVGWDLSAGYIERRYRRCTVWTYYDPDTAELVWIAEESKVGRALCWESPDENDPDTGADLTQSQLVLNAGGRSAQIVKDRTSGAWKTVPDFGWKIEQVAGGADGNAYWRITDQNGQVWRFGYTKAAQWQVPYVGDENGEPCFDRYWNNAIPPTCTGVWRWNLDQETDRNENVIDYSYTRETNYFCLPSCTDEVYKVLPYDRGGFLAEVSWGHNTQVSGSTPTARTVFTTAARDGDDVPTDLHCAQAVGCANDAIAFYSTRKLTTIQAESRNPTAGTWDPVTRLGFAHTWMYQRTDQGPPTDSAMWLNTVQQTGLAAQPQVTLPPLDFDAVTLAGKMDYINTSDWEDQVSWRMVPRIAAIRNGMGGRVEVVYGQADPCGGAKGRDGSAYLADQVGDCYQVDMGSDPESGYEAWTRYYKQLATTVTERDMVAGSPDMVHTYEFLGAPRWTNPVEYVEPNLAPAASEWRGYGQVRTLEGSGGDPSSYTATTQTFLRGSNQQIAHFEGGTTLDAPALQGHVLQEQSWKMTSLNPRAYSEVKSVRYEYTVQPTGNGPGPMDPAYLLRSRERRRESLAAGGWRYSDKRSAFNSDGLPTTVNDYGQDGVAGDNTCTSTSYARNAEGGQWLVDYPSVIQKREGDSCSAGTLISKTINLYDLGTDPATNRPSDGNLTEVRSYADANTFSADKATFDEYGRPLTTVDPAGGSATTSYSPAVGWPSGGIKNTNARGHESITRLSHTIGQVTEITDANGGISQFEYDAAGRVSAIWRPGQPQSADTPTSTFAYHIPFDGGLGQPTAPIRTTVKRLLAGSGSAAEWLTTHAYEDGFGRTRESQTASPRQGRVVTLTLYDPRGLRLAKAEPVYNDGAPGSGLLNPALSDVPVWTKASYDSQERQVAAVTYNKATELRRTITGYPGMDRMEVTPPTGGRTVTVTDVQGRPVKVEEWVDSVTHHDTTYVHDNNGNQVKMTDAKGNVRASTFDWLGRRTSTSDPDSGTMTYGYDLAGRQVWSLNGMGQKLSDVYDNLGRRTSRWAGDVGTGTKLAEWAFDTPAKGHPSSATRYVNGNAYIQAITAYNADYRPTATKVTIPSNEDQLAGEYLFTAAYDATGSLREQRLPAVSDLPAETLTYGYSALGLPKTLTSSLNGFVYVKDTTYTDTGRLSGWQLGADGRVKRSIERDGTTSLLSRVTTQTDAHTSNPQTVQDDRYRYDVAGQITSVQDVTAAQTECFAYDGLRRLKTAYTTAAGACTGQSDGQGVDPYQQEFSYDAVGNITSMVSGGQTASYTYPAAGPGVVRPNAVTGITRPAGTESFAYNNVGQLTTRTSAGKQTTYDWNELGQLSQVTVDGRPTSMVYDAGGERLIRRTETATTLYLGTMEIALSGGQLSAKRYYATANDTVVAMRDGAEVIWTLPGLHGSNQLAVSDATGQVRRERYTPFGQRRGGDDLPFTDRGFLGKTEDATTGLVHMTARYYDPAIAKFIGTDPELDQRKPQWANPYSYAGNNPISLSDPDGLKVDGCGDGSGRMECPPKVPTLIPTPKPMPKDTSRPTPTPRPGPNMAAFGRWCQQIGWENCPRSPHMVTSLYDLFVKDFVDCVKGDAGSCFWAFASVVTAGYGKAAKVAAVAIKAKKVKKAGSLRRHLDEIGESGRRLAMTMANVEAVAQKYGIDLKGIKIVFRKDLRSESIHGITTAKREIHLLTSAFKDEVTLAKTLAHERYHVDQLRSGLPYPKTQAEIDKFEEGAWAFERLWWEYHPLNPKNIEY
ncbi:RHS repeat-associated core domain-containing protein [Nonomuraea endophytica]|uniref:RHS repeat-associated core domain-containing protein n=1 Tax=Nonomuraea endophytica TaxID=714136 RepID=UPI0037C7396F